MSKFTINVPITVHTVNEDEQKAELKEIRRSIHLLGVSLMSILDELKTKVAANTAVVASAITLINGLKDQLDTAIASGDPIALQALSDALGSSGQALADAIAENTPQPPADPAPAVTDPVV